MSDASSSEESQEELAERFDPVSMKGQMIEAEHVVRYAWASQFARGRRALDAGCGAAYGSRMLADAGASEVVGIDKDERVIAAMAPTMPAGVRLDVGDVTALPYEAGEFDLVVCFEMIEHVAEPERVLDELRRVLRPGGLLVISTPNRDVFTPGNPHHLHELTPDELREALGSRFGSVALRRQHTWMASGVLDDERFAAGGAEPVEGVELRKLVTDEPGREIYTLAIASDGPLPVDGSSLALTTDVDLRGWTEHWQAQQEALEEHDRAAAELHARVAALGGELDDLRRRYDTVVTSKSWRLTGLLRRPVAALRRRRPPS